MRSGNLGKYFFNPDQVLEVATTTDTSRQKSITDESEDFPLELWFSLLRSIEMSRQFMKSARVELNGENFETIYDTCSCVIQSITIIVSE
jgi:hypothetical protein